MGFVQVDVGGKKVPVTPCGVHDKSKKTFDERGACTDMPKGAFKCACKPGYTGTKCQTNVNECGKGIAIASRNLPH